MNLASALIKQIIAQKDIETWSEVRKHYLPGEYQGLFTVIEKHVENFRELPSFDDLKLSVRESVLRQKIYSIESIEVDSDAYSLLEYIKNECAQTIILDELTNYIEHSVAISSASENVEYLQDIVAKVEEKVDLEEKEDNIQTIDLFSPPELIARRVCLGLNSDFDSINDWGPGHYAIIGGKKGSGKSVVCSNVADNIFNSGKSSLYFTIEMSTREIMQRQCSINTGVNLTRLEKMDLTIEEWDKIAKWWSDRFEDSEPLYSKYKTNRDWEEFHKGLIKAPLRKDHMLDIVHDPELTIKKIRSVLDIKMASTDLGVVVVDYINQISVNHRDGQYDWKAQIEVSKQLKAIAQQYNVFVLSAFQTDDTGLARFSKGILDAPDGVWSLNAHTHEDKCMEFKCEKVRGRAPMSFCSEVNWECLKVGPRTVLTPGERDILNNNETEGAADDIEAPF